MFLPEYTEWFYLNINSRKLQTGDGKGELCQLVMKKTTSPQPLAPVPIVTHDDIVVSCHKAVLGLSLEQLPLAQLSTMVPRCQGLVC